MTCFRQLASILVERELTFIEMDVFFEKTRKIFPLFSDAIEFVRTDIHFLVFRAQDVFHNFLLNCLFEYFVWMYSNM